MNPLILLSQVYDLPPRVRNQLLSFGFARVIPLATGLGLRVDELESDRAIVSMPLSRRAKNHVGAIYIGALLTQAELTMGLLVMSRCRPAHFRVLVKRNEAEYPARATSAVRAICAPRDDEADALAALAGIAVGAKAERWLTVRTEEKKSGRIVSVVRFLVSVKRTS